jgi:hypothetical protein
MPSTRPRRACAVPPSPSSPPHRHAGLVPVYIAARFRRYGVYNDARCVLALHNLAHQVGGWQSWVDVARRMAGKDDGGRVGKAGTDRAKLIRGVLFCPVSECTVLARGGELPNAPPCPSSLPACAVARCSQGAHPPRLFPSLGLPGGWYGAMEWVDTGEKAADGSSTSGGSSQKGATINVLKVGLKGVQGVVMCHVSCP